MAKSKTTPPFKTRELSPKAKASLDNLVSEMLAQEDKWVDDWPAAMERAKLRRERLRKKLDEAE